MNYIDNINDSIDESWVGDVWNQVTDWGGKKIKQAGDWILRRHPHPKETGNPGAAMPTEYPEGIGENPQKETGQERPEGVVSGQPAPFYKEVLRVGKFQIWYNKHFKGSLAPDGIWGKYTQAAWNDWVNKTYPENTKEELEENKHTRKCLSEETFKKLVKEIIKESIK